MFLLFLVLVVATFAYLRRHGQVGELPWARRQRSPEHEAREILATRFATGENVSASPSIARRCSAQVRFATSN